MSDVELPTELVNRLHSLRISRGLTIQQMAEKCGIPKSSLESYMKMFGAKRPGIDALISIADGMDVSIDWLVGRAADSHDARLTKKDYALACFAVVSGVVNWLHEQQADAPTTIIQDQGIGGVSDAEIAAKAMLEFVEQVRLFTDTGTVFGRDRTTFFDDLTQAARSRKPETD